MNFFERYRISVTELLTTMAVSFLAIPLRGFLDSVTPDIRIVTLTMIVYSLLAVELLHRAFTQRTMPN